MVATLVVNADLGDYASAPGSAQRLPNGNLDFDSRLAKQTIEVLPDGRRLRAQDEMHGIQYRSYIYATLYGKPADSSLPSTPIPPSRPASGNPGPSGGDPPGPP